MRLTSFLIFTIIYVYSATTQSSDGQTVIENVQSKSKIANSDSSLLFHNKDKSERLIRGDTINAIRSILDISEIHTTNGNYSQAYDGYWEALIYSNKIADSTYTHKIYKDLGVLYRIFRYLYKRRKSEQADFLER